MLIRKTPKDKENYIIVTPLTSAVLHMAGFSPMYMDDDYVYYKKIPSLIGFMEREELKQCLNH